jgi:hypothetical protein
MCRLGALGAQPHDEGTDMWIKDRYVANMQRALGRTWAALLTAVAMLSAGIAVASASDWIGGSRNAALVALGGAAFATVAGVQAYWARAGTSQRASA